MFVIGWLVLTVLAGASVAVAHFAGIATSLSDIAIIYAICLISTQASLVIIRLLAGPDQASASQAGMSGMTILMLLCFGGLVGAQFGGLLQRSDSIARWSPLLFLASLTLVSAAAIRTIRRVPAVAGKSTSGK